MMARVKHEVFFYIPNAFFNKHCLVNICIGSCTEPGVRNKGKRIKQAIIPSLGICLAVK